MQSKQTTTLQKFSFYVLEIEKETIIMWWGELSYCLLNQIFLWAVAYDNVSQCQ